MASLYRLDFASGKSYIGATTQKLKTRIRRHELAANGGAGKQFDVHRAWIEFGAPEIVLLAEIPAEELQQAEMEAVAKFNTLHPNGYNLTTGGRRTKFSGKTSERRSTSFTGRAFSDEHRRRISEAAKKRDPSTRKDLSQFWKGKKQSAEHIAKRIKPSGWNHSSKAIAKIRAAALKRYD